MNQCPVCGRDSGQPIRDALRHFNPYRRGYWKFLKGNVQVFGLKDGLIGTLGLVSPAFNTVWNWKYRKHRLEFGDAFFGEPKG